MCVVSAVHDHYNNKFRINEFIYRDPNKEALELIKQALEILKRVDAKLGEPDCVDPKKEEFLKELEKAYDKHFAKEA